MDALFSGLTWDLFLQFIGTIIVSSGAIGFFARFVGRRMIKALIPDIAATITQHNTEIAEAKTALKNMNTELADLKKQVGEMKDEVHSLKKENRELSKDVSELKKDLATVSGQMSTLITMLGQNQNDQKPKVRTRKS